MLQCGECEILIPCSQIRQGIANNTKGTAFVVYEDVMDAKQACDKLNGFNFQNRYLVGESCPGPNDFVATNSLTTCSTISSAREDGTVERGPRSPQGEFRAAQKAARYRITSGRAHGFLANPTANQAGSREPVNTCVQAEGQHSRYGHKHKTWE